MPVHAQVDPAHVGFVNSSVWFDREPFFAGETVRVYTTLANSTSADFTGTVTFFDSEAEIGSAQVTLERNGGFQTVWIDWTPEEGDHQVGVLITNATLTPQGGEPQAVSYGDTPEFIPARFIDTDTDGDRVGNREDEDDDNDGIPDENDNDPLVHFPQTVSDGEEESAQSIEELSAKALTGIGEIASSTIPAVTAAVKSTAQAIENFRTSTSDTVEGQIALVKQRIAESQAGFEEVPEGGEPKKNDPFNQLQLLALTTAGYTLSNKVAFYLAGAIILYLLLKKVIPWIYRKVRGDAATI